jgi:mono/diheme cytochrome c family protein
MPDARGATGAGAYPALASNPRLQAPVYPIAIMLRGQKAMPSFADLSDAQIAELTNYIRTHFGNQYTGTTTADQVTKLRPQQIKRDVQRPG